ncbi:MAG: tail fiber domain-containing protein [Muribaculaceae bacterium]|nr:tail fiber domain-containing protein [Muribaculaceae bacterium]
MKKITFMAVLFCLLASTNQVSAQLIVRNNGHAEVGIDPFTELPDSLSSYSGQLDTVTVLRVFGNYGNHASGAHMTFGDNLLLFNYNVAIGELGYTDTDCLWLQGKHGTYITANAMANDTIMYYDNTRSDAVQFRKDVHTSGLFLQSDERFKENVEPIEDVLGSLENLEAVSYTLKNDYAQIRQGIASMATVTEKDRSDKAFFEQFYADREQGSERYGFLAQNVKEVFPQLVHTDNSGYMYVDYIGLIPILVQSINELRAELAEVKGEKQQEEENAAPMLQAPQQTSNNEIAASLNDAKLYQNAPNPWNSETVIRYSLPQSVSRADIYIYDMQGAQLKSIPAQGRGESQVTLTASDLKAGMYLYALVADGALIDCKQMILTK